MSGFVRRGGKARPDFWRGCFCQELRSRGQHEGIRGSKQAPSGEFPAMKVIVMLNFNAEQEAAAIPFVALTAWRALMDIAKIKKGQRVLVVGGGGAVGLAAIQLATAQGSYVATTCGNSDMEDVNKAGVDQAVHYASPTLQQDLEGRFDAVLDTIGIAETEATGIELLRRGGTYMTLQGEFVTYMDKYGLAVGGAMAAVRLAEKQFQYKKSHGINYSWAVMRTDEEGLQHIAGLARGGRLRIPVGKVLPLTSAAEAHTLKERRLVRGKVVLQTTQEGESI